MGIRNSILKEIYNRMFNWLVQKLNRNLLSGSRKGLISIGILDIFGFENFTFNTLE
jgi:myosin heavy subunit